ncbi:MAG: rhodanese-like domain-containing protein [Verrucomicrobiota bacterium]
MKRVTLLLTIILAGVALISCQKGSPEPDSQVFEVIDVEADEALALVKEGAVAVLDVRTQAEWDKGHIENAVHVDISDPNFEANMAKISYGKPFVVH